MPVRCPERVLPPEPKIVSELKSMLAETELAETEPTLKEPSPHEVLDLMEYIETLQSIQ